MSSILAKALLPVCAIDCDANARRPAQRRTWSQKWPSLRTRPCSPLLRRITLSSSTSLAPSGEVRPDIGIVLRKPFSHTEARSFVFICTRLVRITQRYDDACGSLDSDGIYMPKSPVCRRSPSRCWAIGAHAMEPTPPTRGASMSALLIVCGVVYLFTALPVRLRRSQVDLQQVPPRVACDGNDVALGEPRWIGLWYSDRGRAAVSAEAQQDVKPVQSRCHGSELLQQPRRHRVPHGPYGRKCFSLSLCNRHGPCVSLAGNPSHVPPHMPGVGELDHVRRLRRQGALLRR